MNEKLASVPSSHNFCSPTKLVLPSPIWTNLDLFCISVPNMRLIGKSKSAKKPLSSCGSYLSEEDLSVTHSKQLSSKERGAKNKGLPSKAGPKKARRKLTKAEVKKPKKAAAQQPQLGKVVLTKKEREGLDEKDKLAAKAGENAKANGGRKVVDNTEAVLEFEKKPSLELPAPESDTHSMLTSKQIRDQLVGSFMSSSQGSFESPVPVEQREDNQDLNGYNSDCEKKLTTVSLVSTSGECTRDNASSFDDPYAAFGSLAKDPPIHFEELKTDEPIIFDSMVGKEIVTHNNRDQDAKKKVKFAMQDANTSQGSPTPIATNQADNISGENASSSVLGDCGSAKLLADLFGSLGLCNAQVNKAD